MKDIKIRIVTIFKDACKEILKYDPKAKVNLDNFLQFIGTDVSNDYIYKYVLFQIQFRIESNSLVFNSRIPSSHIFSKKAIERWKRKSKDWNYFLKKFCSEKELEYHKYSGYKWKKGEDELIYEDRERRRYFNKATGFLNCFQKLKELYDKNNQFCNQCDFSKYCIDIKK